jgi:S-adenosyl methyltransferase
MASTARSAQPTTDAPGPVRVDRDKASIARVYNATLGGKDNYAVDREVFARMQAVVPEVQQLALDHRAFLIRATRFIATQTGVVQYLDCGSGLPTAENTHQVAQRIAPASKVVYVDNDPSVVAHGRALLEDDEQTLFIPADIFTPSEVVDDTTVRSFLDFEQPIALFLLGVLHHYDGTPTPAEIVAQYVDALPSGSYLALTHFLDPEDEDSEVARRIEHVMVNSPMGTGLFRTRAEIAAMIPPELQLVDPGLVQVSSWWPDGPQLRPLAPAQRCAVGVVARKP